MIRRKGCGPRPQKFDRPDKEGKGVYNIIFPSLLYFYNYTPFIIIHVTNPNPLLYIPFATFEYYYLKKIRLLLPPPWRYIPPNPFLGTGVFMGRICVDEKHVLTSKVGYGGGGGEGGDSSPTPPFAFS